MCFRQKRDLVTRRIAGETVIVPVRGGVGDLNSIYTLNQPGTLIWELLGSETPLDAIVGAVWREYDVTEDVARKDIGEFLQSLKSEDLISSAKADGG